MIKSLLKGLLGFLAIGVILWPWYGVWISLAIIQIRWIRFYAVLVLLGFVGHLALFKVWLNSKDKTQLPSKAWWFTILISIIIGAFLIYYLPQRWL